MSPPATPTLTVSVVTPCRDAERLVAPTVASVLGQTAVRSGRVGLQYIVVDGASRDRTTEVVRATAGDGVLVMSEPDRGMYDALAKGLRVATGEVVAYLNAGDVYAPGAFEVVADLFARAEVRWLTGLRVECNEHGSVVSAELPVPYRRRLLAKGAHDGVRLDFVQQESTFWRRELLAHADLDELASYRLAGDAWLWTRFARVAELHVVEAYLGGFTRHPGQQSERMDEYQAELSRFARRLDPIDRALAWFDRHAVRLPPDVKKRLAPDRLFRYSFAARGWI